MTTLDISEDMTSDKSSWKRMTMVADYGQGLVAWTRGGEFGVDRR